MSGYVCVWMCVYYELSLKDVMGATSDEVSDGLELKNVGGSDVCNERKGVMASTLGYLELPFAQVTEKTCVHRGDPVCRFEIYDEHALHVKQHLLS